MKNTPSFSKFLFSSLLPLCCVLIFQIGCGKKNTQPPPPNPPAPSEQPEPADNNPTTPTPVVVAPTLPAPLPQPVAPQLSNNVITNLIQEVRDTRFLNALPYASDEDMTEISLQKTRNLTTANTLKRVDLDFDRQGVPELAIHTQEGQYEFEISEASNSQYTLSAYSGKWYNPVNWFSSDKPLFTAHVDVRTNNNNIAVLELIRHDENFDSHVYIVFLRKYGQLQIQYPDTYSSTNLHPDSLYFVQTLSQVESVSAHFYQVLTEFEEHNTSQATQFSIKFGNVFQAYSLSQIQPNKEVKLQKNMVWYGSRKSPGGSLWNRTTDFFHNTNSLRQGQIHSLKEIIYTPSIDIDGLRRSPIESSILNFRMTLRNRSIAQPESQTIQTTVEF